ncbi:unnamed protein product [Peniophora sp. CBMAI 1063]|nr:unnamed protein product [Peniophora sp. CBMAI 1063]
MALTDKSKATFDFHEDEEGGQLRDSESLAQLQKNPSTAVQRIRELYAARVPGGLNENLCKHLHLIAQVLDSSESPSTAIWQALMKEGLFDVYRDMMVAPGFFEEKSELVIAVVNGLASLPQCCSDTEDVDFETVRYLLLGCPAIFEAIWKNRDRLKELDTSPFESAFEWCVFHWADMYQTFRNHTAGMETYIPHVSLYTWVHLHKPNGASDMALAGMRFLSDRRHPLPEHTLERFTQVAVIDGIGGDILLARFEDVLHEAFEPINLESLGSGDVLEALGVMSQLVKHPRMRALVQKRETFRHIVAYMDKYVHSSEMPGARQRESAWTEWEMALFHFELITEDLKKAFASKNMSHVTVRGEDIATFLARGTELVSRGVPRDKSRQIAAALHLYGIWAKSPEWRRLCPSLTESLVRGAQNEWIPTLKALDTGAYRQGMPERVYKDLTNAWRSFGTAMGLNESKERKRYANERQKFCSYSPCQWSKKESDMPLLSCKGCGEARYCGKECQRGDWKVHKKTCGDRLK